MIELDRRHLWHPYAPPRRPCPLTRWRGRGRAPDAGRRPRADRRHGLLVGGDPRLQPPPAERRGHASSSNSMAHVMFGGLTHEPAVGSAGGWSQLTPAASTGCSSATPGRSPSRWRSRWRSSTGRPGADRETPLADRRGGYHGDTFGAMSVCDPVTGMHHLFSGVLPAARSSPTAPNACFRLTHAGPGRYRGSFAGLLSGEPRGRAAAVILEPVVQGAGGMRFYHPEYLRRLRRALRRARRAAHRRRDRHRLRPQRPAVRLRACRHRPDIMCSARP